MRSYPKRKPMSDMRSELTVSLWRGARAGPIRGLQCPAARKPDRARCRDFCSAPSRPDAVLPFCLPGRRVRFLCHDGEWPTALDLPHACIEAWPSAATSRSARLRTCPSSRTWSPICARSSRSGSRRRACSHRRRRAAMLSSRSNRTARRGLLLDAAIECINCGICYAACDTVRWNSDYLGPAALNRAWTLVNDTRDAGNAERLQAVAASGGCHACHSHQSCQEHCPQALNPTASIAGLKRRTMSAYLKGEIKV